MSGHIALLHDGGAIERRRDGRRIFYTLTETGKALGAVARAMMGDSAGTGVAG